MDPSILKSLQKIEELVKNKKNIIEQIPVKSNNEPLIIPKASQIAQTYVPQMPIIPQNVGNSLINALNLTNPHIENNMFMNRMPILQTNPMSFNDGILIQNQIIEPNIQIYSENDKILGKTGLISKNCIFLFLFIIFVKRSREKPKSK